MGNLFEKIINFLTTPTAIIVITCVAAVSIFTAQIIGRIRYAEYGDGDIETYDLTRLILSFVILVVYGVLLTLIFVGTFSDKVAGYISLGLLGATIILQIVFKDPIFLVLWKIPTWALFFAVNAWADDHVTGYTAYIGPMGDISITEDKPVFVVLLAGIVAFILFVIKALIICMYSVCSLVAVAVLSCGPNQILYGVGLHKDRH